LKEWRLKRGARIALLVISGMVGFILLCWISVKIANRVTQTHTSTETPLLTLTENSLNQQTNPTYAKTQIKQEFSLKLDSNTEWQDTNINIQIGDEIQINAQGEWKNDPGYSLYDANGYAYPSDSNCLLSTAKVGALIGKIGDCQPFLIGIELTFNASCTGNLFLSMNDSFDGFGNNVGELTVKIELNPTSEQLVPTSSPTPQ
jgi:hypothetical protein